MKRIYIKAFNKLTKMGVPVYEHHDDKGNFSISAEDEGSSNWVASSTIRRVSRGAPRLT